MIRTLLVSIALSMTLSACGGAEPRAAATWETHTASSEDVEEDEGDEAVGTDTQP